MCLTHGSLSIRYQCLNEFRDPADQDWAMAGTQSDCIELRELTQAPLEEFEVVSPLVLWSPKGQVFGHPLGRFARRRPTRTPAGHETCEVISNALCRSNQLAGGQWMSEEADVITAEEDFRRSVEERDGTTRVLPQQDAVEIPDHAPSRQIPMEPGAQVLGKQVEISRMHLPDGLGEERTASNVVMMSVRGQHAPYVPREVPECG
jgi:hypothetical protein